MADLSERDKQILFGQGRSENETIAALARADVETPGKRLSKCESRRMSAIFVIITGLALLFGGYHLNGDTMGFEKILGFVAIAIGALWFVWMHATVRKLRLSGVQPE